MTKWLSAFIKTAFKIIPGFAVPFFFAAVWGGQDKFILLQPVFLREHSNSHFLRAVFISFKQCSVFYAGCLVLFLAPAVSAST